MNKCPQNVPGNHEHREKTRKINAQIDAEEKDDF